MKKETKITFLGTADCVPTAGHDTASFVINGCHLVDAGWYSAIKMLGYGINPMDLKTVFISHCHHDHYIGLPHILFYLCMKKRERPDRSPLKIVGPEADIQRIFDLSKALLQPEIFHDVNPESEVIPIAPGESFDIDEFHVDTCKTIHPVQGLCYRFTDKQTQASFVYTGDTAYNPLIADLARGSALLIHEASHGANAPEVSQYSHSGALQAGKIAKLADIQRLILIHCPASLVQQALATARQLIPDTFLPDDGQTIIV